MGELKNNNVPNAKRIIDRLKNAYNMDTDTKLADFLGVDPSTLSSWKRRNSVDLKLIFAKCPELNANYLVYEDQPMFRDPEDPRNIKKPESQSEKGMPQANDQLTNYHPGDLKQQAAQFVHMIENLPWPVETRREILQSYLRIVDDELHSLQEHTKPDPPVDN